MEDTAPASTAAAVEGRSKRERKPTAAYQPMEDTRLVKEIVVPAGTGCTLGSVRAIEDGISKRKADDDVIRHLHNFCFGSFGVNANRKKNLRLFCGFSPDADKMAIEAKLLENKKKWTVGLFKECAEVLSLERSGTRDELCRRLVDYLAVPSHHDAIKVSRISKKSKVSCFYLTVTKYLVQ